MTTYQIAAVFRKSIEYYAIEADSEQAARARAEFVFAPNLEFFYIDTVSELDGIIPSSDSDIGGGRLHPPTLAKRDRVCPFCHDHVNILTLPAIDGATEVLDLNGTACLCWCPCGGVWLEDDDGIKVIGSNHPGDQQWFIRKYCQHSTPSEAPKGMRRFDVEAEINGIIHHYYVEAGDYQEAQVKVDKACGRMREPIVMEITRLTDLPRKG